MLRWFPLVLVGCGFQLGPGGAAIEDAAIDASGDAPRDGTISDGTISDGPPGDGSGSDAPTLDASADASIMTAFCNSFDANLRACYRFENNLVDGSMYTNTGTSTGTSYQGGHVGQALNAQASTVTVPNDPSLSLVTMTLKMWIRPSQHPTGTTRMGLVENDAYRLFTLSSGRIRCAINAGGVEVITTAGVPLNTWSRVACTYDLSAMRVYIDGVEVGTTIASATIAPALTNTTIGRQEPSGETFFGLIDDLQIFNGIVAP